MKKDFQVERLLMRLDEISEENENYQTEYVRQKGKLLGLETPFLLLHVLSNKYLSCSEIDLSGDLDLESMNLCLEEEVFENSIFVVKPPYRSQMDSLQYVRTNQPFYLSTRLQKHFVDVTKPNAKGNINFIYSSKPKCKLEFQIIQPTNLSTPDSENQNIYFSDVVWIHHAELELNLTYTPQKKEIPYQEQTEQTYRETQERIQFSKMIKKSGEEASSNAMWILENEVPVTGGKFCFDLPFRLKHFRTGRYLTFHCLGKNSKERKGSSFTDHYISPVTTSINLMNNRCDVSLERAPSSHSVFLCTLRKDSHDKKKSNVQVVADNLVQIQHWESGFWLSLSKVISRLNEQEKITVDDILYPTLNQKASYEDIFKFYRVSSSQMWETSFLMYMVPILYAWEGIFKTWDLESLIRVDKGDLVSIRDALKNMILFCCQGDDEFTHSSLFPTKYGMKTNLRRQKIFKEQNAIELLLAMISEIFKSEENLMACLEAKEEFDKIKSKKDKKKTKIITKQLKIDQKFAQIEKYSLAVEILKNTYELLAMIVHENNENKKLCYDHITSFAKHIGYEVGSLECFSTIVENNEQILSKLRETTIEDKSLIDYLISLLNSKRPCQTEVLKILEGICHCNKVGITANQLFINSRIFPHVYENSPNFVRFTKEDLNPMKVQIQSEGKTIEKRLTELHSNEASLLFFELSLFASLAFDRNYSCRDKVIEILPFEVLSQNMCNSDVPDSLSSVFCNLISDCHIDCKPLRKVNIKKCLLSFGEKIQTRKNEPSSVGSMTDLSDVYNEMLTIELKEDEFNSKVSQTGERINRSSTEIKLKNGTYTKTITLFEIESLKNKIVDLLETLAEDDYVNLHFTPFILSLNKLIYRLFKFNLYIMDPKTITIVQSLFAFLTRSKLSRLKRYNLHEPGTKTLMKAKSKNLTTISEQKKESIISKTAVEMFNQRLLRNCIRHMIEFQNRRKSTNSLSLSDRSLEIFCKIETLKILLFIFETKNVSQVAKFINFFTKSYPKFLKIQDQKKLEEVIVSDFRAQNLWPKLLATKKRPSVLPKSLKAKKEVLSDLAYGENDDYDSIYTEPFFKILINLINQFEDSELHFLALKLLLNSFSQRERMVKGIKRQVLLFSKSEKLIYHYAEKCADQLITFSEESEAWLHFGVGTASICDRVAIMISALIQMLYEDCFFEETINELSFMNVNSTSKISYIRQMISKGLRIPDSIISFLRNGTHLLEDAESGKWKAEEEMGNSIMGLIRVCYSYLTLYMSKNRRMSKKLLSKNMSLFLMHMKYQDVGQISFFSSIIKNRVSKYQSIMRDLLLNLLQNIGKIGRKGSLIKFLCHTLREHNEPLFEYQSIIVQTFFESMSNINYMLFLKEGQNGKKVFDLDYEGRNPKDEPYIYHRYMIKIILICMKNNTQQASFIKTSLPVVFSLESLLDLLLEEDAFMCCVKGFSSERASLMTILKEKVLSLVHLVFLLNYSTMFDSLFDKIGLFFQQETKKVTNLDYAKVKLIKQGGIAYLTEVDLLGIDNPNYSSRFAFDYGKWLVNYVFPFVTDYIKVMQIGEESAALKERKDIQAIGEFCDKIRTKASLFAERLIDSKEAIRAFQKYMKVCKLGISNFSSGATEEEEEKNEVPEIAEIYNERVADIGKKKTISHTNLKDVLETRDFPFEKFLITEPEIYQDQDKEMDKKMQVLHKETVLSLMCNKKIMKDVDLEYDLFIQGIKDLPLDSFSNFVKAIIVFVESALNKPKMKKVAVESVRILNSILESCYKKAKDNGKGASTEEKINELVKYQNLFVSLDVIHITLTILYNEDVPLRLTEELMVLLINLLEGGNSTAQEVIYIHFISSPVSEVFFKRIWNMIEGYLAKKVVHLNIIDSAIAILKNLPLVSSKPRFDLVHVLRLLQLLCEGHFLPNQNYMRNQFKSRRNYNMIVILVRVLEVLQDIMSINNYFRILQCIDTLIEFVQGPCYDNRAALIDTKFFYFCAFWLQDYYNIEKKQSSMKISEVRYHQAIKNFFTGITDSFKSINLGFSLKVKSVLKNSDYSKVVTTWMHSRIQFKILVALESLLEGKNRGGIVKNILPIISPVCLDRVMKTVFNSFKDIYGMRYDMEVFKHIDQNISKLAKKRSKSEAEETNFRRMELIIETGFKAYGILKIFMDIPEKEFKNDLEIKSQIIEIKKEATKAIAEGSTITEFVKSIRGVGPPDFDNMAMKDFLKKVGSYKKASKKMMDKYAYTFFGRFTGSIEVIRDNMLEQVNFPLLPYCLNLDFRTEKQFLKSLDRMSLKSKLVDLMEESELCVASLKYIYFLQHYTSSLKIFSEILNNYKFFGALEFLIILLLNFILFVTVKVKGKDEEDEKTHNEIKDNLFCYPFFGNLEYHFDMFGIHLNSCEVHFYILILGIIQISLGMFAFILYMIKIYWVRFRKVDSDFMLKERLDQSLFFIGSIYKKIFVYVWILATDFELIGYFISLVFNIASLISPVPFHSLLLVVAIFRRSSMMRHIMEAIWRPRKALFFTLMILAAANYIFSFFEILYFEDLFNHRCDTLLLCTYFSYDRLYKYDGGIGGFITNFNSEDGEDNFDFEGKLSFGRFLFDFFSNFVILVLISEILSGIIIDTFGSLREENIQRKNDIQNVCFICGADRTAIEKMSNTKGFYYHITVTHNLWHYMLYIAYLRDKEITEYSGMESYIISKTKIRNIDWFPHLERDEKFLTSEQMWEEEKQEDQGVALDNEIEGILSKIMIRVPTSLSKFPSKKTLYFEQMKKVEEQNETIMAELKARMTV